MKKYLYIFKFELMSTLQYVFNVLIGFIGHFIMLFILFNLYQYLYSDPNELIKGYSSTQMIWYVVFTELIWGMINGRKFCKKISNDVKGGNIIYNINKPYNYISYALSSHLGENFLKSFIYLILSIVLGLIFTGSFPNINIIQLLIIAISLFLAVIISDLVIICIGLLSFKIEDSNPIYWVYSKLLLLLGVLFPIEFFPTFIQPIINYSPIYVTISGPAKLFVDFSYNQALIVLIFQLIYLIIILLISNLMYKKGVKKLNVNGG